MLAFFPSFLFLLPTFLFPFLLSLPFSNHGLFLSFILFFFLPAFLPFYFLFPIFIYLFPSLHFLSSHFRLAILVFSSSFFPSFPLSLSYFSFLPFPVTFLSISLTSHFLFLFFISFAPLRMLFSFSIPFLSFSPSFLSYFPLPSFILIRIP